MTKYDDIMLAAVEEFSHHDYETSSLNKIISTAHTSKGNFYHFFKNKSDLYVDLMFNAWQMKIHYQTNHNSTDIFEWLEQQMLGGIRFAKDHPNYYQLYKQFINEPNLTIKQQVLQRIADHQILQPPKEIKLNFEAISPEYTQEFTMQILQLMMKHIGELIDEKADLQTVEKQMQLVIRFIKLGITR